MENEVLMLLQKILEWQNEHEKRLSIIIEKQIEIEEIINKLLLSKEGINYEIYREE